MTSSAKDSAMPVRHAESAPISSPAGRMRGWSVIPIPNFDIQARALERKAAVCPHGLRGARYCRRATKGGLLLAGDVRRQLAPSDRELVDLVGAVGEAQRAQVRICGGEVEVVGDAAAAVHLDRAIQHLQRHVGGGYLDRGDLGAGVAVAD